MWPNPQEALTVDLVTFTEEIRNGKLHFLGSVSKNVVDAIFKYSFLKFTKQLPFKTLNSFIWCSLFKYSVILKMNISGVTLQRFGSLL